MIDDEKYNTNEGTLTINGKAYDWKDFATMTDEQKYVSDTMDDNDTNSPMITAGEFKEHLQSALEKELTGKCIKYSNEGGEFTHFPIELTDNAKMLIGGIAIAAELESRYEE